MTHKNVLPAVFAAFGMLILILDSEEALMASMMGMELCIKTVVPSLFPFLFLCGLITDSLWGRSCSMLKPLCSRLGIPPGAESLLMASVLGGYPAGAAAVGDAYRQGRLTKQDAHHLLYFCSNAGPAFLFGMTGSCFQDRKACWILWLILMLSAAMTGALFPASCKASSAFCQKESSVSDVLKRSICSMALICGWVLLFRVLSHFLTRWVLWYFPTEIQVSVTGLLELSNGCLELRRIESESLRFLICSGLLSWGGLCVAMQTSSVIGTLSLKPYLLGKTVQTGFSLVLSLLYLHVGLPALALAFPIILFFPGKPKKEVDFRKQSLYNGDIINGRKSHAVSQKN